MSLDLKAELLRHLRASRAGLIWKTDSLSELDLRLPRTPTGTSLLGLVKHCAYIQHGYFVDCLGQSSELELVEVDFDADPNGDLYATADETAEGIIALFSRVNEVVDEVIERLPLDAPGHVPWWGADTTLGALLVHVLDDVTRHAGQADIVREGIDSSAGLRPGVDNLWEPVGGWSEHVHRLTQIARNASSGTRN